MKDIDYGWQGEGKRSDGWKDFGERAVETPGQSGCPEERVTEPCDLETWVLLYIYLGHFIFINMQDGSGLDRRGSKRL
jgi:hypothetical protein